MSERVRIGLIGCGAIVRYHVQRLSAVPEVEIAALCDTSEASIRKLQEKQPEVRDLPVYRDYRDLLAKERLDAVEIASPHTLHFPQIMDCLDAGLHVLVEKPMACTVAHARRVMEKAEETGKVLAVSYQRHFEGTFQYMRERFRKGEMGELVFLSALQGQRWVPVTRGTWRQDPELAGGGQLNDSGSHLLDILLWVTGLGVSEVFAFVDLRDTPVDVNSAISLRFENGAAGSVSVVGDARGWWEDLTFWGENGTFYYRNGRLWEQMGDEKPVEVPDLPGVSDPDRNFVYGILGREEILAPPVCGLRVIEVTEAAWLSCETGAPVRVRAEE